MDSCSNNNDDCCDTSNSKAKLTKRALLLEYFTVSYNILECILSIFFGFLSGSIALIGFGLDSAVESISGGVLIWRLKYHGKVSAKEEERIEKKAITFVGYSFFVLGAYVFYESVNKLYHAEVAEPTIFGIIIAATSLIIMPILAYMKHSTGKKLELRSLIADSRQTIICSLLSLALLIGLGLNYKFGLWWADPVTALVIVGFIFKEGFLTLKEGKLCTC